MFGFKVFYSHAINNLTKPLSTQPLYANQYVTDTDSFDALKDAMLKFYRYDFSFLETFSWSLL